MIKNYLKVAWRNLFRNKAQSFINIAGLSVGLACSLLIMLWVQNEESIDAFHSPQLYSVLGIVHSNHTNISGMYDTPGVLSGELKKVIPEVEYATGMGFGETSTFRVGDKILKIQGNSAGADYFKMFSFPLIEGTPQTALSSPSSLAISRKMAEQFFGSAHNAIGKNILYQNTKNFTVTAVFENLPKNVSTTFDFLTNWETFLDNNPWARSMGNVGPQTFVTLRKDANASLVDKKLAYFYDHYYGGVNRKTSSFYVELGIQPYAESYLHNNIENGRPNGGRIEYVHIFSIVAVFILLIACINFMNLATARSDKRAKEVGVRKVLGAERRALIRQFIGEAMVLSLMAVLLGVILIALAMPAFALLIGKPLELRLTEPLHLGALAAITLICGLVAGSYPALYLSGFNPIFVFKGIRMKGTGAAYIRKGLVVLQFTISVILIISTVIIYRQIDHILTRDIGYTMNGLVTVNARGKMVSSFPRIREDLIQSGAAERVALSSYNTLYGGNNGSGARWEGLDERAAPLISYRSVTPGFLATAGMKLAGGRDFREDLPTADSNNVLITESLARMMGKGSAVGKRIWFDKDPPLTVVGVVKDFVFGDMYGKPEPVMFFCDSSSAQYLYIRLRTGLRADMALAKIQTVLKQDNPGYPVEASFVDDDFNALFRSEALIGNLSRVFAALAILISCLGLFGLSAYMAERRIKEIGIRKVLGASVPGISVLLSKEFLQLVGLSTLIAFPLAWLMMHHWLQQYSYRIGIEWWIFLVAGAAALLIAMITVSTQAMRAALMNPTKALRSE